MNSYFQVSTSEQGMRLDKFLTAKIPQMTRSFLQKIIADKLVLVNQKIVQKASLNLAESDQIIVKASPLQKLKITAEELPLEILYEDLDLIVINKPAGMVVHPSETGSHQQGTIVNALLHHCRESLSGIGGVARPGILHRLDKDTSGILVAAKNDAAHQFLALQWQNRTVKKYYLALVKGKIKPNKGSIEAPLSRSAKNRQKIEISGSARARHALTHYEVLEEFEKTSLLKIQIVTGRTHQIRVHFAAIGFPIVGDALYGDEKINHFFREKYGLNRQFLHSFSLEFDLPATGKRKILTAPLSADLEKVLNQLKGNALQIKL